MGTTPLKPQLRPLAFPTHSSLLHVPPSNATVPVTSWDLSNLPKAIMIKKFVATHWPKSMGSPDGIDCNWVTRQGVSRPNVTQVGCHIDGVWVGRWGTHGWGACEFQVSMWGQGLIGYELGQGG